MDTGLRIRILAAVFAWAGGLFAPASAAESAAETAWERLTIAPAQVELVGPADRQQLLVTGLAAGRRQADLTRDAVYESATPGVVQVDSAGLVRVTGNGEGRIIVRAGDRQAQVAVRVSRAAEPQAVDFERDVQPILTRFGCNAGACHGKQRGQNGFQLSLLGFDPEFDYAALTKEARGRRVFPADPATSLLLRKPTAREPHGGGKRLSPDGDPYAVLLRWIESGTPRRQPGTPALERILVEPGDRVMASGERQQLLLTAVYSDGSRRDVTRLSAYQSNESAIAKVDENGLIEAGEITGEAAVMARYMDQLAVSSVAVPLPGDVPAEYYAQLPRSNFIDEHVWTKLERLRLKPSDPAADHAFLRRAYIDIIGRLPTADEARAFLDDESSHVGDSVRESHQDSRSESSTFDKREKLVDHLLAQPEYAEHWANKWADLLRPNPYRVGIKATLNFDHWIRDQFRKNRPWDEFVRELLTAQGSTFRNGAVTLFRDRRSPDELTTIASQLFLGVRLECAKCHHHPFEVWGQDDFYSFAAYFAKIGRKGRGISPPISGSEEIVFVSDKGSVEHPLTGETLEPRPLFGKAPSTGEGQDPRKALAAWMTSDENDYFAQVMANRVWADLMGRGLVEPVDDLRGTNPPTNGPLLEALAEDFRKSGYDIKQLIRRITTSHVYSLSSLPGERNVGDLQNYSRYYRQRLRAEVLLDAAAAITGVPQTFEAMPPDSRARELWTHRIDSMFLDAFGRPDPNQDPPCERVGDTTLVQALHLMNSRDLYRKVTSDKGRAAQLAAGDLSPGQIVEELYLSVYSRYPEPEERRLGAEIFDTDGTTRRQATEDLLWALLNTPEFVFKN